VDVNSGNDSRLKVLVGFACYGRKNLGYLDTIIRGYRDMGLEAELVVFSEEEKQIEGGVKQVVGLPTPDPWSLPFAHKEYFAREVDRYDLFIYSEDDVEVKEAHIRQFVRAAAGMGEDEIPGFLRYEVGDAGKKVLTDVHGSFRWKPESVKRRGPYTIAEFTNEHAGLYMLTQGQLRRAIASGGFLTGPYQGRYGLPETAATDPYTQCGFRKVICVSMLEEFLVRHMSNLYVGRHGVPLETFKEQVGRLLQINEGKYPASTLCAVEPRVLQRRFSKAVYAAANPMIGELIPVAAREILVVGCGWEGPELQLGQRGARVTALPVDSVVGLQAERLGMEVIYGKWQECLAQLEGRQFDSIVALDFLHLRPHPDEDVGRLAGFLKDGGVMIVTGPNFRRLPCVVRRAIGSGDYRRLGSYETSGVSLCRPGTLKRTLERFGVKRAQVVWTEHGVGRNGDRRDGLRLGALTARQWILRGEKRN
jgi:2-polyprenyl-3-methyl-5-hydroxy-6-metoxy-1,4-benzoquinol methylase